MQKGMLDLFQWLSNMFKLQNTLVELLQGRPMCKMKKSTASLEGLQAQSHGLHKLTCLLLPNVAPLAPATGDATIPPLVSEYSPCASQQVLIDLPHVPSTVLGSEIRLKGR